MIFIYTPQAWRDLDRLYAFLVPVNPSAAARAIDRIVRRIQSLDRFPGRGRPSVFPGARELMVPFGQSSYIVRYAHDPGRAK
ncbi:MAG: type II toxin-antitoxin system RelE/ParE family toxin [Rhizomicrobium sp.]